MPCSSKIRAGSTRRAVLSGALLAAVTAGAVRAQDVPADAEPRVARREASPRQLVFGNVLSRELGLRLVGVQEVKQRARWGGRELEGHGPCVALDGLEVTRLVFDKPLDALDWLVHVARPARAPLIADARGRQLVLLGGRRLLAPEKAARVLRAAWADEVLDAPDRPVEALRVASPPLDEAAAAGVAFDAALFLGRGDTPAWAHTLEKLKAARDYATAEPPAGGAVVHFLSTNHFTFESPTGGFSQVAMSRTAAIESVGRASDRCRVLVEFGRELLEALGPEDDAADSPRRRMLHLGQRVLGSGAGQDDPTKDEDVGQPER